MLIDNSAYVYINNLTYNIQERDVIHFDVVFFKILIVVVFLFISNFVCD